MKKKDYIEKILEIGTFISFTALIITVLLQVFMRFALPDKSFIWTEEASRFFFIYSIAFAAPLAMKKHGYVNVDLILNILPKSAKKAFDVIINLTSVILFAIVFFQSIKFAKLGIGQTSPAMKIPMYISYSSIVIMAFFVLYYGLGNFLDQVRNLGERGDSN